MVYSPKENEKSNDVVVVFEKNFFEVAYDSDGQAVIYETVHILYHVNNLKGVDEVNKGYMATRNILEEIDLNARSISSSNKVSYFNRSSIKEVDKLENIGAYKLFAIDGVEPGSDVEIIYTNKKQYYSYSYNIVSSNYDILDYEARIISPKNLVYDVKSYNGLTGFQKDTMLSGKNQMVLNKAKVNRNISEKYAFEKANMPAFMWQLSYNYNRDKAKIYSWEIISKEVYNSLYNAELLKSKQVKKLLESNKIIKKDDPYKSINELESYVKTNFEINDKFENYDLAKSIDLKKISENNVLRLYISAFKLMEIPFELVLTKPRNDFRFDSKFPSYLYTSEYMFYFPDLSKYMSPLEFLSRIGFPNPNVTSTEGLFLKETNIGDIFTATSKVKPIKYIDHKQSFHNYDVVANLNFSANTVLLDITQKLGGYSGYYIQPVYKYLNEEQKEEYKKSYYLSENVAVVKDYKVSNFEEKDLFVNPMTISYNAEQNDLLENAGNKYLFKVGFLIGKQEELYQEQKRTSTAEMTYPHQLDRVLKINIPEGFKPVNLNDLVINKVCMVDGVEAAVFNSSYQLKDNQIIVSVYEDYKRPDFPISVFNEFKAVINAAADFNKKTLIFEKN